MDLERVIPISSKQEMPATLKLPCFFRDDRKLAPVLLERLLKQRKEDQEKIEIMQKYSPFLISTSQTL